MRFLHHEVIIRKAYGHNSIENYQRGDTYAINMVGNDATNPIQCNCLHYLAQGADHRLAASDRAVRQ